jgi:hypothetical protein
MGNATSSVYSKGGLVPTRQQTIRQLFEAQYQGETCETSVFSYTTDASVSAVVPDITRSVIEKVQASRQVEGMIPVMYSEVTSTGVDLVVPRITPLEHLENAKEELILGLYSIGRTLHLLHSIHRLSHNNVCTASIFRHHRTGCWLLTEDLVGDLKVPHFSLIARATALLDPIYVAPEFNGSKPLPDPATYPIHARDAFAYANLVKNLLEAHHLPCPSSTRALLTEMTSNDYKLRPTLDRLLNDTLFTTNAVVKIVARLMDLRQGSLNTQGAEALFKELPIILPPLASQKSIFRIVMDQITKYSVFVHPAALSTKFMHSLLSARLSKKIATETGGIQGILSAPDYRQILVPFLEECWRVERPGLATILLKLIGRYIYKLNPKFVRDVLVKRVLALNILVEPSLGPAYVSAYPILLKHHMKKNYDIAPLTRHLVKQVPLFVGNDVLRTKALTCLLVHPKIPNLLLKEYLARGLTDQSPQVRLDVIKAINKFALQFADNSGPMSAKCLADALMGSLMLSMVDVDAKVRAKARNTIRKLTFVMERKEEQIIASLSTTPLSPSAIALNSPSHQKLLSQKPLPTSPMNLTKPTGPNTPLRATSGLATSSAHPSTLPSGNATQSSTSDTESSRHAPGLPNNGLEAGDDWNDHSLESEALHAPPTHEFASPNGSGWSTWDDWEEEDADFEEETDFNAPLKASSHASPSHVTDVLHGTEVSHIKDVSQSDFSSTSSDLQSNDLLLRSPSHHSQKLEMEASDEIDAWGDDEGFDLPSPSLPPAAGTQPKSDPIAEMDHHSHVGSGTFGELKFDGELGARGVQNGDDWGLDDDMELHPSSSFPDSSPEASSLQAPGIVQIESHTVESPASAWEDDLHEAEPVAVGKGLEDARTLEPKDLDSLSLPELGLSAGDPQPQAGHLEEASHRELRSPDLLATASKLTMSSWDDDTDAWDDNEGF